MNTFAFSQANAHPRPPFCEDLTTANIPFSWVQYMNSTLWGRNHVAEVEAFYVCWFEDHERPGFYFRLQNGEAFRIDPLGGKKCPLEGNAGPLNEQ